MCAQALPEGVYREEIVFGGEGALRLRLLDMGVIPKTHITVTRIAPMGDPVEVFLRGYTLSLRLEDAAKVEVELA